MQRTLLPLFLLLLLGLAVWGLWSTRPQPDIEPRPEATPTVAAVEPTQAPRSAGPPPGYRLAGLAVGDPTSYAAIELPDGSSHLYRVDSDVPGLGRVTAINHAGAEIETENGTFTLQLQPAATATPDRRRINGEGSREPTTPPKLPEDRDDTTLEPAA